MSEEIAQNFHPKSKFKLEVVVAFEFQIKHQVKSKIVM